MKNSDSFVTIDHSSTRGKKTENDRNEKRKTRYGKSKKKREK